MFFKNFALKFKLNLLLFVGILNILLITIFFYFSSKQYSETRTYEIITLSIDNLKSQINSFFENYIDLSKSLAFITIKSNYPEEGYQKFLYPILEGVQIKYNKDILTTYVGFEDKEYEQSKFDAMPAYETNNNNTEKVIVTEKYDHKDRIWYKAAKELETTIITPPYIDATTKKMCITIASPIIKENVYLGTAAIDLAMDTVYSYMKRFEKEYLKNNGHIILVSQDNKIIYHSSNEYINKNVNSICDFNSVAKHEQVSKINCNKFGLLLFKKDLIPNSNYSIYVMVNYDSTYKTFNELVFKIMIISLIFSLFTWIAHKKLNKYIIKSLNLVQEGLFSFFKYVEHESDSIKTIEIDTKDEIGQMSTSLNEAIKEIKTGLEFDEKVIDESIKIVERIQNGVYDNSQITANAGNPIINRFKDNFNKMNFSLSEKVYQKTKELESLNRNLEEIVIRKTEELHQKLVTSSLTGLFNIIKLQDILSFDEENKSLLFLDICNFNQFNYAYGLKVADTIIIEVGKLLKKIIPPNAEVFHFNGDRFVVCLFKPYLGQAEALSIQVESHFERSPIFYNDVEVKINFHIGIVENEKEGLIKKGIIALAEAKSNKFQNYSFYQNDSKREDAYKNNIFWAKKVKKAVDFKDIIPYFQPIVNNKTLKVEKFEVLARMIDRDNNNEIISPYIFLKHAQRIGLLRHISKIIIEKSFRYFSNKPFDFSINITSEDFLDPTFSNYVTKQLKEYNIDAKRVIWEILENVSLSEDTIVLEQIKYLKNIGCQIAVDDFGSEYSNFSRLLDLQVDIIKIDGTFIKNIDVNENSYKIVKSIVAFAKNMNSKVVAEFVHSESVWKKVAELDIDYSQGYYFKPLPSPDIEQ